MVVKIFESENFTTIQVLRINILKALEVPTASGRVQRF